MYLFNVENILEILMLGFSFYLCLGSFKWDQMARNISSFVVLISWGELFMLIGRHPKLYIYLKMLLTVSKNFMKFLMWSISVILAFGLAFFFILQRESTNENSGGEEAVNEYFASPQKSLLKTVVMSFTGELEFAGTYRTYLLEL